MDTEGAGFRERLQSALGGSYTLERELGGGGMARVFLAEETALGRRVVVKVLPPELAAAISAERFRREIRLAAGLQHPHVVPVLSAGEAAELLYYTMPYVDGESLRQRLARDGELPVAEAVRVLREVADALACAHEAGIVHRDIKPENILLARGHALVVDFGVARALGAATGADAGAAGALTSRGFALGTPAYMAPEQAAADDAVDQRADLYALGVVAYEMLAGSHPFAGRLPAAMLAAHAVSSPEPLTLRRPAVPAGLAALVMRLLEKRPADRPQQAAEVLRELDAVATSGLPAAVHDTPARAADQSPPATVSDRRPLRRTAWPRAAALLLLAAAAGGGVWAARSRVGGAAAPTAASVAAPARARVLVDLFENRTGDSTLDPVGQMAADWVVRGLTETDLVDVVDASSATAMARAGGGTTGADSTTGRDRSLRIAGAMGAGTLVVGRYYRRGDTLEFQAQVIDARDGRVLRSVEPAAGLASAPGAVVGALRSRVMAKLATLFDPELTAWPAEGSFRDPPSYEVYRELQAGAELFRRGDYRDAIERFERAERLDPTAMPARFYQALSYRSLNELARADSIRAAITRTSARLTSLESESLDALAATLRGDLTAAYELAKPAAILAPNTYPHVQLGAEALRVNRVREAVRIFREIDPDAPVLRGWRVYYFWRSLAHHLAGEHAEALAVARRGRARHPTQPLLAQSEVDALAAVGRAAELDALLEDRAARSGDDPVGHGRLMVRAAVELRTHGHAAASRALADRAVEWLRRRTADRAGRPVRVLGADPERDALVLALYRAERWREARALVEPLAAADSATVLQLAYAGLTAARLGDTLAARRYDARLAGLRTPYLRGGHTYQRARIAAVLGDRARAVALIREAFTQGTPYFTGHAEFDLEGLRGYAPYDDLVRPKE